MGGRRARKKTEKRSVRRRQRQTTEEKGNVASRAGAPHQGHDAMRERLSVGEGGVGRPLKGKEGSGRICAQSKDGLVYGLGAETWRQGGRNKHAVRRGKNWYLKEGEWRVETGL